MKVMRKFVQNLRFLDGDIVIIWDCKVLQELAHILDFVMSGIKKIFSSWNETNNKDKLSDFVEMFWNFVVITSMGLKEFTEEYLIWDKEKKYHWS